MKDKRIIYGLLAVGVIVLIIETIWLLPLVLERWHPYDYAVYANMGRLVREGQNPYRAANYWIFPAILWVCVPLSWTPDWFVLVWILLPMISLLVIHRRDGLILLLFTPLWLVIADAMLEGALLLPVYWLLQDAAVTASLGAVALLTKPQLALLPVGKRAWDWLRQTHKRPLAIFLGALAAFILPSFVVMPDWPLAWLKVLPMRAAETTTILPLMTASVWSWLALGIGGKVFVLILLIMGGWLFWRAWRAGNSTPALLMAGLFLTPVLFASSLFIAAAALRGRRQIELATALSLAAWLVDRWASPFAGVYALIPLLILWFYRE
jgi:hypothetical protein